MSATFVALWASIVRTVVPVIVGGSLAWATSVGLTVDGEFEALLTAALTALFTAAYYTAVRLLETYVAPRLGWLLGAAKAPKYPAITGSQVPNVNPPLDRIPGPDHRANQ